MTTARLPKSNVHASALAGTVTVALMLQGCAGLSGQLAGSCALICAAEQASKAFAFAAAPPVEKKRKMAARSGPGRSVQRLSEKTSMSVHG
jgi:hypothetical protein